MSRITITETRGPNDVLPHELLEKMTNSLELVFGL